MTSCVKIYLKLTAEHVPEAPSDRYPTMVICVAQRLLDSCSDTPCVRCAEMNSIAATIDRETEARIL